MRQLEIETEFCCQLPKLFDIGHAGCKELIKIPEDWCFLEDQRGGKQMLMGEEDLEFRIRYKKKHKRIQEK